MILILCRKKRIYTKTEIKILRIALILITFRLIFPVEYVISRSIYVNRTYFRFCQYMRSNIIGNILVIELFCIISLSISVILLIKKIIEYRYFLEIVKMGKIVEYIHTKKYNREVKIPVIEIDDINMSFIVGIINPKIVIYNGIEENRDKVIMHEVRHYLNNDLFYKWLFEIANILYWWNPIIYLIKRYFSNIVEINTDFGVIENASYYERMKYVELLLAMAKKCKHEKFGTGIQGEGFFFKTRILTIIQQNHRKNSIFSIVCLLMVTLSFVFVLEPETIYECKVGQFTEEDAYILYENNFYKIYMNGKFVGELKTLPQELEDWKIYIGEK